MDFMDINDEHKAVVFSQHRGMLGLLADQVSSSTSYELFHGGMNAQEKDRAKHRFETDPDTRLFISSDAGGFGLNLQAANLLVNYDLPWSFGKKVQRDSRIIRAGSRWPQVSIESFLMDASLEMRQHQALEYKSDVADAILDGGATDRQGNVLAQTQSLRDTLQQILVP
jgi:SNF2 family DNA or RNA helicase